MIDMPSVGIEGPSAGIEGPGAGIEVPSVGIEVPSVGIEGPSVCIEVPSAGIEVPSAGIEVPSAGIERPSVGIEGPSASIEVPSAGIEVPSVGIEVPSVGITPNCYLHGQCPSWTKHNLPGGASAASQSHYWSSWTGANFIQGKIWEAFVRSRTSSKARSSGTSRSRRSSRAHARGGSRGHSGPGAPAPLLAPRPRRLQPRGPRQPQAAPQEDALLGHGHINLETDLGVLDVLCELGEGEGYDEILADTGLAATGIAGVAAVEAQPHRSRRGSRAEGRSRHVTRAHGVAATGSIPFRQKLNGIAVVFELGRAMKATAIGVPTVKAPPGVGLQQVVLNADQGTTPLPPAGSGAHQRWLGSVAPLDPWIWMRSPGAGWETETASPLPVEIQVP